MMQKLSLQIVDDRLSVKLNSQKFPAIPYSQKIGGGLYLVIWRSACATAKLKSAKISYSQIYTHGNPVLNRQI